MLLAIAISAAVSFMQATHVRTDQLFDQQAQIYTSPLSQFFKWDMITYFDEALHTWFYSHSGPVFTIDCQTRTGSCFSRSPPLNISKNVLADAFVTYLFANPKPEDIKYLWRRIGAVEYLFYVITGSGYGIWVSKCVDVEYSINSVKFTLHGGDRGTLCAQSQPKLKGELKAGSQTSQWEMPLLGDSAIQISIQYPWKNACTSATGTCSGASGAALYYGAMGDECGDASLACGIDGRLPVVSRNGEMGEYLNACSDPWGSDWAKPNHWEAWRNDLIKDFFKKKGWTVDHFVRIATKTKSTGIKYIRLLCFGGEAGKLLGAFFGGGGGPWCVEIDRGKYYDNGPNGGKISVGYVTSAEVVAYRDIGSTRVFVDFKNVQFKSPNVSSVRSISTGSNKNAEDEISESGSTCEAALAKISGASAFFKCPQTTACSSTLPCLDDACQNTSEKKGLYTKNGRYLGDYVTKICYYEKSTKNGKCSCEFQRKEYTVNIPIDAPRKALQEACEKTYKGDARDACVHLASQIDSAKWIDLAGVNGKGVASVTVFVLNGMGSGCIRSYCGGVSGIKNAIGHLNNC